MMASQGAASDSVKHRVINPWSWQDAFGFAQAHEIRGSERTIFCAGQASVDEEGRPLHAGDMRAQIERAFDNLQTVLEGAGTQLSEVARLNYYTTDIPALFDAWDGVTARLVAAGCRPASTLFGVQSLAYPELLLEIEATAVTNTPIT